MKPILTILLICGSVTLFAQSKKTINKTLSLELKQLAATNDSLKNEYANLLKANFSIHRTIRSINDELVKERSKIRVLGYDIYRVRDEMINEGFDPDQFVKETELNAIHSMVNTIDYDAKSYEMTNLLTTVRVDHIGDISGEKIKVQNELLQAKINEYKLANENDLKVVFRQQQVNEELEHWKRLASDQLDICGEVIQTLDENYALLAIKQVELEEKAEEELQKRLAEEEKKKAKNKKSSKVKFIPPVIDDEYEEIDYSLLEPDNIDDVRSGIMYWDREETIAETVSSTPEILEYAEVMPEFPGGTQAMFRFFADHLKYPESAKDLGIQGKVYLKFVVSDTGQISDIKVIRGVPGGCVECEAEAKRVISIMPKWNPGKNNGEAVSCYFTVPVVFKLEEK